MCKEVDAWNEWVEKNEEALDALTLGEKRNASHYLTNRMNKAFQDGLSAGRQIERAELQARAAKVLFG